MRKKIDITVAIVSYETREETLRCIDALLKNTKDISLEIYVVDNNSSDGTVKAVRRKYPKVTVIANAENRFCTVGNNQVFARARGRYCLVLNPDVQVKKGTVEKLMKFLDIHENVSAVTCKMILPNGQVDKTCTKALTPTYKFFSDSILAKVFGGNPRYIETFHYPRWDRNSSREVETISDIIVLYRTDVLKKLGYYDESILLYFMEDDLSLRMHQAGYQVWHLGNTSVYHSKGASTKSFLPKKMYTIFESDMLYFYRKHFGFWWYLFLKIAFVSNRVYYFLQ